MEDNKLPRQQIPTQANQNVEEDTTIQPQISEQPKHAIDKNVPPKKEDEKQGDPLLNTLAIISVAIAFFFPPSIPFFIMLSIGSLFSKETKAYEMASLYSAIGLIGMLIIVLTFFYGKRSPFYNRKIYKK